MLFATVMKDLDVKHNKEIKLLNSEVKKAQVANEKKRTTKKNCQGKSFPQAKQKEENRTSKIQDKHQWLG